MAALNPSHTLQQQGNTNSNTIGTNSSLQQQIQQQAQQQIGSVSEIQQQGQPSLPNSTNYAPPPGDNVPSGGPYGKGTNSTPNSGGPGSGPGTAGGGSGEFKSLPQGQPKRLHVSNIPFRFREPDLRQLFYVSMTFHL